MIESDRIELVAWNSQMQDSETQRHQIAKLEAALDFINRALPLDRSRGEDVFSGPLARKVKGRRREFIFGKPASHTPDRRAVVIVEARKDAVEFQGGELAAPKTLKQIQILGLTDDARSRLGSRLPVRVGDILSDDTFMRTIAAVREYDEHMNVSTRTDQDGSVVFTISAPGANKAARSSG